MMDARLASRWTIRLLTGACVLLALMCLFLAVARSREATEAACFRQALAEAETPAIADTDCID